MLEVEVSLAAEIEATYLRQVNEGFEHHYQDLYIQMYEQEPERNERNYNYNFESSGAFGNNSNSERLLLEVEAGLAAELEAAYLRQINVGFELHYQDLYIHMYE